MALASFQRNSLSSHRQRILAAFVDNFVVVDVVRGEKEGRGQSFIFKTASQNK